MDQPTSQTAPTAPAEKNPDPLLSPKKSILRRVFALIRITLFLAALAALVISLLPKENLPNLFTLTSLIHPFSMAIAAVGVLILGTIFYIIFIPTFHKETIPLKSSFDLESMTGIVMGIMGFIFMGMITLFTTEPSVQMIFALIIMGMYTFYVYKIIKDTWVIQKENAVIRKKYGELVEVDKEKSDFIMVTSHQLRTPLTEIRWSLDQITEQGGLDDKFKVILQKTLESVSRLANIVDDMLKTRAFEVKNHVLKKTAVDAADLLTEIIASRELLAQQKNASLNFERPEKKILLDADKDKTKIALENIIDNAIRYSPNGKVNVSLGTEGKKARITIEDSGIGIDIQDQKRIFTKFFRTKNAMLVQPDGSGIGLYATKNIIEQHGGTINFFSELNKGTKFIVTLPLAK